MSPGSSSDANASSTPRTQLPASSPSKTSTSPPFADNVVRPFTSQGSTFSRSSHPLSYAFATSARASSDYPSTGHDSPIDPTNSNIGPYMSASARTSYTRVDVDSLPSPEYPPLPPMPSAHTVQDAPAAVDVTALPAVTTATMTSIMPTTDTPTNSAQTPISEPHIPQFPQVSLTFLLVSGHRKTQSFDPETTVGRVKELVWNAWPARDGDWQDERPPAPSYLRILYLGKILQDDETLLRVGFPTSLPSASTLSPTIVHLSIRPYAPQSDDLALNKKKRLSVAITRRFSSAGVTVGVGGGRDVDHETEAEPRRTGCCTGCVIC